MGEIRVLNQQGDVPLTWDPKDEESTKKAKEEFDRLKKDGYEFFEVVDAKGKRLTRFDRKLGKIIAAPGARSTEDKRTGTRERAASGGPKRRVVVDGKMVGAAVRRLARR